MEFILYLRDILFSFGVISILFFLPGLFILSLINIRLSKEEGLVVAPATGIMGMTLTWYLFSWLHLRFLLPLVLIGMGIYLIKNHSHMQKRIEKKSIINRTAAYFLFIMSVAFFIPFMKSGDFGTYISLVGVHYQDSPLHVAMINELVRSFPPMDPGFTGSYLTGYHFFYNLVASCVVWIFRLPTETVHFRTMPILFSLLWPFLTYVVAKRVFKSTFTALLTAFLVLFGASFSPLVVWIYHVSLSYNSGLGVLQPPGSLLNPPFASSIIALLVSLYFLVRLEETKNMKILWLLPFCFGSLVEFKVYAGMVGLAGFGMYTLFRLRTYTWKIILSGLAACFVAFLVYWPFTGSSGYLVYAPFWVTREIARTALPFLRYDNAIYVYKQMFDPIRPILLEIKLLLIFIFGNLGLRSIGLIGFFILMKKHKEYRFITIVLGTIFLTSFLIPLFFMQSLKPFEISQMFNYSLFALSFPTAYALSLFISKRSQIWSQCIISSIVVLFSIPQIVHSDYPQYILSTNKPVDGRTYQIFKKIRQERKVGEAVLELPSSMTDKKKLNEWFRYNTNLIIPAFTDTRAFLLFTNIIYSESEVIRRLDIIKRILEINETKDDIDQYKNELGLIWYQYNIRFITSPIQLNGLENKGIVSLIDQTEDLYVYTVKD